MAAKGSQRRNLIDQMEGKVWAQGDTGVRPGPDRVSAPQGLSAMGVSGPSGHQIGKWIISRLSLR
jgi:hypothetical protein